MANEAAQAFITAFLGQTAVNINRRKDAAEDYADTLRESAARGRGRATQLKSAANGILQQVYRSEGLGASDDMIDAALRSGPTGILDMNTKLTKYRTDYLSKNKDGVWNSELAQARVSLPEAFEASDQGAGGWEEIVNKYYGVGSNIVGDYKAEPRSWWQTALGINAKDYARQQADEDMSFAGMSTYDLSNIDSQLPYNIQGTTPSFLTYNTPNEVTADVIVSDTSYMSVLVARVKERPSWDVLEDKIKELDGRKTSDLDKRKEIDQEISKLRDQQLSMKRLATDTFVKKRVREFGASYLVEMEEYLKDTIGVERYSELRVENGLDPIEVDPIEVDTIKVVKYGDEFKFDKDGKVIAITSKDLESGEVVLTTTDPDAIKNIMNLKKLDAYGNPLQKDGTNAPVAKEVEIEGVSNKALENLTSFISSQDLSKKVEGRPRGRSNAWNNKYKDWYDPKDGTLSKSSIAKSVAKWAKTWNGENENDTVDVATILGFGSTSLPELTDYVYNLINETGLEESPSNASESAVVIDYSILNEDALVELVNDGDEEAVSEIKRRDDAENKAALEDKKTALEDKKTALEDKKTVPEDKKTVPLSRGLGVKPDDLEVVTEYSDTVIKTPDPDAKVKAIILAGYDVDAIISMLKNTNNVRRKDIAANRMGSLNNAITLWARKNEVDLPKETNELKLVLGLIADEFLRQTKGK